MPTANVFASVLGWNEAVCVLANMAEAMLGGTDERRDDPDQDQPVAPGSGGVGLCPPVDVSAGAGAHRVHSPAVRPGRAGDGVGWAPGSVQVIDADLGVSGRSTEGRDGFRYLISRVCLGEVGAVFGLEVSRLARSTADLTRLLELARLTDTLLIDGDGVYDLTDFNDRLF